MSESTAHSVGWQGRVNDDASLQVAVSGLHGRPGARVRTRSLLRRACTVALVLAIAAACVFLRPRRVLDGPVEYVVVAGTSMEPHFEPSDLVIVRRAASYHVGEVISYVIPKGDAEAGRRVIHRIVGGSAEKGWITRGDNRNAPDPWRVPNANILGRQWIHIPVYGTIEGVVSARVLIAALISVAAMAFAWPAAEDVDPEPEPDLSVLTRRERRLRRRRLARWRSPAWR